ncbi:TctA family transporter [Humitalea rosea]|uniref:TctA family transporter n=1 Tax=Humitalea rosea TaxID=990373 RepID=A0A2W7J4V6_9PROT|nr:tripartite tricarboxylate transporter permease [Humitalea rosea]PZW46656.1 TctA family transporter [Humitalea rosea]
MDAVLLAFEHVFSPGTLLVIALASCLGIIIGAMPGLTAVMGTALLVPFTFFMDPVPAIAAIVSLSAMAIFAGDIPSALVRIPGTPGSAAYCDEAYKMTLKGEPWRALGMCMAASSIGGVFGTIVLIVAAPTLALFATKFSSPEYFWLSLLGLTCAAFLAVGSPLRGLLALLLGLFLSAVGIDIATGITRFAFGSTELMGGVDFVPALIGFFAIPELVRLVTSHAETRPKVPKYDGMFRGLGRDVWRYKRQILRGNIVGTLIGALPGAGADIAAWVSYALSRKLSKQPEKFGTGHVEGLAEASASNNAALGGAWVPTIVFGIPGDSITAIVIGVLVLKGMEPGPSIFIKTPDLIYAVFIVFILANLLMVPLGWMVIRASRHILSVPRGTIAAFILVACIIGSYAINNALFDVGLMLAMGALGWFMEENDIPVAPAVLGLVLGKMVEFNFVQTMMKGEGDPLTLVARPIAGILAAVVIGLWLFTAWQAVRRRPAHA